MVPDGYGLVLGGVRDDLDQAANLRLVVQTHAEQLCTQTHRIVTGTTKNTTGTIMIVHTGTVHVLLFQLDTILA